MLSNSQAAQLALLVLCAEDMYEGAAPTCLAPAADPRIASAGYTLRGHLVATDCVFRTGQTLVQGETVCYGYLAQSDADPTQFVVAIRGTQGIVEWIEDAEFVSVPHPVAGRVEAGFYDIYTSLQYHPLIAGAAVPAAQGLALCVGEGGAVQVVGHSLGSALATYLAFDLAAPTALGPRATALLFASPRPGDTAFCAAVDARLSAYQLFNYELDLVPRVPVGPDYADLPRVTWIRITGAQARVRMNLLCHHHVLCYAAMLDYDLMDWGTLPPIDQPYTACIMGPA